MRIASFHIDGFGIFSNVTLDDLPRGLSIFFGLNEAGKSTCLEFLRSMLRGYKDAEKYRPLAGGQPGGSLKLRDVGEEWEELTLVRRPGKNNIFLSSDTGQSVPTEALDHIFSGINAEVYRKVFGFSLGELESFESLKADEVRNALYGASFGAGLKSPADALKKLQQRKGDIFKPRGKQLLNQAFAQHEEMAGKIADLREKSASYDGLRRALADQTMELERLRSSKEELESERRRMDQRLRVWEQWEKWHLLGERLKDMRPQNGNFPLDARARLAKFRESRERSERSVRAIEGKLASLRSLCDSQIFDEGLLSELPLLRRLSEQKSSYRHARSEINALRENYERAGNDLAQGLAQLGPDWDCGRIRATDRSLFKREDLEEQANELESAEAARQAAVDALNKSNADVASCEKELESWRSQLEALPAPRAVLSESERDELREDKARLDEVRRAFPGREKILQTAKASLDRALAQAQITLPHQAEFSNDSELVRETLARILGHQEEAAALAHEASELKEDAAAAVNELRLAENEADGLKTRLAEAENAWRAQLGPGREILEAQRKALKDVRSLAGKMEKEKENLRELDSRINLEKAARNSVNWAIIILGALFFLASGAIFCAHRFWGMTELALGEGFFIPLNLWAAYVALACGAILMYAGWPGSGADHKRRKLELAQLESRRENSAMQLAELGARAEQACKVAEVDDMDDITLEAREMLLEREREQCVNEERSRRDIDALKDEYERARKHMLELETEAQAREALVQKKRKSWYSLLEGLNSAFVPSPEGWEAFFARVEVANTAYENAVNARMELDNLWSDLNLLEDRINNVAAVRERLSAADGALSLESAVSQVLDSCGEAEEIRSRRNRCEEAIKSAEDNLGRAREEQSAHSAALEAASASWEEARSKWKKSLADCGLDERLKPDTARQAYLQMNNCLQMEEQQQKALQALRQAQEELESLSTPMKQIMERLGKAHDADTDWLATLDELTCEASRAHDVSAEKARLIKAIDEQENELAYSETDLRTVLEQEKALLKKAGAEDEEEFLRLAVEHEEREKLEAEHSLLEGSLKLAANGEPLEEFTAGFRDLPKNEQESRLAELDRRLAEINGAEFEAGKKIGEFKTRCDSLASSEELPALRQEEAAQEETMAELAAKWSVNALAISIIEEAKSVFERERQPRVIKTASEIFRKITDNRWSGISSSLEKSNLSIISPQGELVDPANLSRGAQEQAYLALRLAYIEDHSRNAPSLPVIMDEILVNFDPDRAERSARALADLAANNGDGHGQQIFYFTCQPHMVETLRKVAPHAPVYEVKDRNIRRRQD